MQNTATVGRGYTLADIKRATIAAGGTVEEDHPHRDMRVFQLLAPDGKVWSGNDCACIRVDWAKGSTNDAISFNQSAFSALKDTLSFGLRDMTADEAYLYATD